VFFCTASIKYMADDHSEGGPCKTPANQNNGDGDDDGKDVGVIMAAFPDGSLGTDGNKPGVVAQFFCEGEEVIFVSYPRLTLLRRKLIIIGDRGRLPLQDAVTRYLPRIPNAF